MRAQRGDGEVIYKQRYVLCLFRGGFVTWNIQSNDPSSTCHGNYHTDLREALDGFDNRIHPSQILCYRLTTRMGGQHDGKPLVLSPVKPPGFFMAVTIYMSHNIA